ncbi:hypothetical protein TD95_001509, partial [Thielaviopsis punctulata]
MPGHFDGNSLSKRFEKLMHKVEGRFGSGTHNGANGHGNQYPGAQSQHAYNRPVYNPPASSPPPGKLPPPIPPRSAAVDARADELLGRAKYTTDIFTSAIATSAPISVFHKVDNHPVPRLGITKNGPIQTNKFQANLFLGDQKAPVYTQPYSVWWTGGTSTPVSWGMAVSHTDADQRVFGPTKPVTNATQYFYNPIGISSLILSSNQLSNDTVLTTENITAHSVMVHLRASAGATPAVSFPLVQGMGFVTALYSGSRPVVKSGVTFRSVTRIAKDPKPNVAKWKVVLNDGKTWWIYAYCTAGSQITFKTVDNTHIEATEGFNGVLQVAKEPGTGEAVYDRAAGVYVTTATLSGSVSSTTGTYSFTFDTQGNSTYDPLMYVLPHHRQSWDSATEAAATSLQLQTPTKGIATGVLARKWTFVETNLPTDLGFAPYAPGTGSKTAVSAAALDRIHSAAQGEVAQNVTEQAVQQSMYFSGKALAKFALIAWTTHTVLQDANATATVLGKLKDAFEVFANNTQPYPLYYESAWGGIVSSGSYITGNDGVDFGNTYYNDHHFHWGHFVLAAAVIGSLDRSWLTAERKAWVDTLVRDYANPSAEDPYFPQWRMYDWYNGHSWAAGLFPSNDGKNQESSSEDNMSIYALRMWGVVTGDDALRDRSTLQLMVLSRSLQNYYLYTQNNTVQPANFIDNRVAGILFENKIDHTTWFGANLEYIQGIHMLPLLASTPLVRTPEFVQTEWAQMWEGGRAEKVEGGWRGILFGNLGTIAPQSAWNFFTGPDFTAANLDGGASLTWYLMYAAGKLMSVFLVA